MHSHIFNTDNISFVENMNISNFLIITDGIVLLSLEKSMIQ